jgi:hypothetical protein
LVCRKFNACCTTCKIYCYTKKKAMINTNELISVTSIHHLQNILRNAGLRDYANNFRIPEK